MMDPQQYVLKAPVAMDPTVETWALEFPGALSVQAIERIQAQLTDLMPGKRVFVTQEGGHFRALEPIDAAWAEAVAAADAKGWHICELTLHCHPGNSAEDRGPWMVEAHDADRWESETGEGDTPAAALRALAAKLREQS